MNRDESCAIFITNYGQSKHEIMDVLNRNRADIHDEQSNESYFEWKYIERAKIHGEPKVILFKINNKIIGSLTAYPTLVNDGFNLNVIYHLGDISVDKEYRKQGYGSRMIHALMNKQEPNELYIVSPNETALSMFSRPGWLEITRLRCYTYSKKFPLPVIIWFLRSISKVSNGFNSIQGKENKIQTESQY